MNHKAFSITTAAPINKLTMGAAFPPKATFPLPLNESEVTAFKDAQHRALPASFEELLALHSEQPPTQNTRSRALWAGGKAAGFRDMAFMTPFPPGWEFKILYSPSTR
jgi:hypothetical protein